MNKKFTKSLILLSLFAASLTACKKDKDEEPKEKTRTEILTAKEWKYVDYGEDTNNDGTLSQSESYLETCEVDDTYKFNTDGTIVIKPNSVTCDPDDATETITWKFQNNETEMVLSTGRLVKIKTLNETSFELTSEPANGSSTTKVITIFKH